jgi:5-methylthioadenosine/S-adenosylhomocysteine deaminase
LNYLVRGEFVLTMCDDLGSEGIIQGGAVFVSGKRIIEVGRYQDLKTQYPTATVVGSPRFWVMPGFVNAHQHGKGLTSFQLGGVDEAFELSRVNARPQARVPAHLDTLYAAMRMIEAGITTCFHYNASRGPAHYEADVHDRMRAYDEAGMRVSFGLDIRNRNHLVYGDSEFLATLPADLREKAREKTTQSRTADPENYFRIARQLCDDLGRKPESRIKPFLTPAGPQWCSEDLLGNIREFSEENQLGIQIHLLETKYQRAYFLRTYGQSAVEWLDRLRFLSTRVTLAHGVWLGQRDIALVAQRGCALVNNPSSNLRLKSGIAPLQALYAAGVPLALGLDSSSLNDDMDMLQEMRLCANLQRVPGINAPTVPLKTIFHMATAGGCNALGWGQRCGTLTAGQEADIVLLDTRRLKAGYLAPEQNPIDALLYRGRAGDVDTVMVAGEILYQGREHQRLDSNAITYRLKESIKPAAVADVTDTLEAELLPYVERYYRPWDADPLMPHHIVNAL